MRQLEWRLMMRIRIGGCLALVALLYAAGGFLASRPDTPAAAAAAPAQPDAGGVLAPRADRVVRVVDGDTVETVGHPETVRLLLVDTDETRSNRHGPRTCWGPAARARLAELAGPGADVIVATDRQERDRYGRWLAHLALPDGTDIGLTLIAEGLGDVDVYPPNDNRADAYRAAETDAQIAGRGRWSGLCPDGVTAYEPPPDSR